MNPRRDEGAAVVEFSMISVLIVLLLLGVLQVGVYFYVRNIVAASAADAARYAAALGVPPSAGGPRAQQEIAEGIGARAAADIRCTSGLGRDAASGLTVTTVHCSGRVRALLAPVDLPLSVDIRSSALREGPP